MNPLMDRILLKGIKTQEKKELNGKNENKKNTETKINKTTILGTKLPPLSSFSVLNSSLQKNLYKHNYIKPLLVQKTVIPYILHTKNIIVNSYTGSGKTLSFVVPLLHKKIRAIILVPSLILLNQIFSVIETLKSKKVKIFKLQNIEDVLNIKECTSHLSYDILICLFDVFINSDYNILIRNVEYVIIDEIDMIYKMSSKDNTKNKDKIIKRDKIKNEESINYKDNTKNKIKNKDNTKNEESINTDKINKYTDNKLLDFLIFLKKKNINLAVFSATITNTITDFCCLFKMTKINISNLKKINHEFLFCTSQHLKSMSLKTRLDEGIEYPVLVFVKKEEEAKKLKLLFKRSEVFYKKRDNNENNVSNVNVSNVNNTTTTNNNNNNNNNIVNNNNNIIDDFRLKKIWILFCGDEVSRGMDFYNVKTVINYDYPTSKTCFIHRIGRVNRNIFCNQKVITLFTKDDFCRLKRICCVLKKSGSEIPESIKKIMKSKK